MESVRVAGLSALIVFTACAGLSAQEMLSNTTLTADDTGGAPAHWGYADYRTGGSAVYEATGGREGTGAAGVTCADDSQRGAWRQRVQLEGAHHLRVAGVYRTEGIAERGNAVVRLTWLRGDDGWDFIDDVRLGLEPSEQWSEFEEVFRVPDEADAVVPELFNFYGVGTVWWDEIHMREATREEVMERAGQKLDRPPQRGEVDYSPQDGDVSATNPPAFVWLPVEGIDSYVLQYAPEGDFDGADAVTIEDWQSTVYTPHETIAPGNWAWRYGFDSELGPVFSDVRRFTIPEDAVDFPLPRIDDVLASVPNVHPRAYFHRDNLDELRRKVEEDPEYAEMARGIINRAEREIGKELYPEPDYLPDSGIERSRAYQQCFRTMRPFTAGMEHCAKAYVLTGDERFGNEAKRRLMHYMSWDPDGPTSVRENDEAAMDLGKRAPRTYDWIHDLLSEEERATCQEVLGRRVEQMNELHRRMPFTSRPYSSHPGRMIGFVVEDSIILAHEVPEAREWLDYTLRLLWSVYPAWGNPDGGWAEGPSYWRAYIGMLQPTVLLLDDIGVPFKDRPFCRNNGWFGLYGVPVGGKMRPFGDGHSGSVGPADGRVIYRWASLYDNPYWRWYAEQLGAGPGSAPGQFGFYAPDLQAKPPTDIPQARVFEDIGLAAMHSNLADPANNVYLLMRSSPYGAVSHSHASQNAIAIGAFGQALAISSGYYQLYGCPHHSQWTWETRAHCSILVNGEGQVKRNPASRGRIVDFDDQDQCCYAVGDATEAYGGRLESFLRRVLFIRPDTFVICDELKAPEPATYQWLLHAREEMALDEDAQTVTISAGDARLRTQLLRPEQLDFSQMKGFPVEPEREAPDQYHFTADTREPSARMVFHSVLTAFREGDDARAPACEVIEGEGGHAVTLTWPDDTATVLWKLDGADRVRAAGHETEADVAVIRRGANGDVASIYSYGGTSVGD